MDYKKHIKIVQDFPKEGIEFKDITPLMDNGKAFRSAVNEIVDYAKDKEVDVIVGPEERGFIIGCPVAYALEIGFIPVRKIGKLQRDDFVIYYRFKYRKIVLALYKDALNKGKIV